jgi:hypothetical protein
LEDFMELDSLGARLVAQLCRKTALEDDRPSKGFEWPSMVAENAGSP